MGYDYDYDFSHGNHELAGKYFPVQVFQSHPTNLFVCAECSRCGSPVTDSLETEIEQHGKVEISTEMDIISRYFDRHIQLWDAEAKAHMMANDKQKTLQRYNEEAIL